MGGSSFSIANQRCTGEVSQDYSNSARSARPMPSRRQLVWQVLSRQKLARFLAPDGVVARARPDQLFELMTGMEGHHAAGPELGMASPVRGLRPGAARLVPDLEISEARDLHVLTLDRLSAIRSKNASIMSFDSPCSARSARTTTRPADWALVRPVSQALHGEFHHVLRSSRREPGRNWPRPSSARRWAPTTAQPACPGPPEQPSQSEVSGQCRGDVGERQAHGHALLSRGPAFAAA